MYTALHCIALRRVRYNDRNSILTAWTRQLGRVSLLMPDGNGPESRRRRALTLPMSFFECQADLRPGRDIHTARDVRPLILTPSVTAHPVKAAIAIFMADILHTMLRDTGTPDEPIWNGLGEIITTLDNTVSPRALANIPLWFLYRIAVLTGIEPDTGSWRPGYIFDLDAAVFRASAPGHSQYLDAADAAVIPVLSRLTPRSLRLLALTHSDRQRALDTAIRYLTIHHTPLTALQSLDILRTTLSQ